MAKSVFLVGPERQVLEVFDPLWGEINLEPCRYVSAESALEEMRRGTSPQGVLITYPLWDATLEDVVRGVRNAGSSGEPIPTFVVAPEETLSEVGPFETLGVTILSDSQDEHSLRTRVREAIFPIPRAGQRVAVKIEVQLGTGRVLRLCQSENISISGMLVRTAEEYPIGSAVEFEFGLPGQDVSIRGEAQIVRYTEPDRDQNRGVGMRFLSFEEDGYDRLRDFIG